MSLLRVINRASLTASLLFVGSAAFGDTRALMLHHVHTDEKLTVTYKENGQYDRAALKKINWIMRDWRKNEATTMDPQTIDLLWEIYQGVGAKKPIEIIGGYRSPSTNEMLRTRSPRSGVARYSQHMFGKAIDFYIPGVPLEKLRETAMRLQGGGVGLAGKSSADSVRSSWSCRCALRCKPGSRPLGRARVADHSGFRLLWCEPNRPGAPDRFAPWC